MKIIHNLKKFNNTNEVHLALGNFDGVHNGHKAVIKNATTNAKKDNSEAWILTFDPHPLKTINPKVKLKNISTIQQRLSLFKNSKVNGVIILEFNNEIKNLSPINFLNMLRNSISKLSGIYVGEDWSFGKDKSGNQILLKEFCKNKDIIYQSQKSIIYQNEKISSTRIRDAIMKGNMTHASSMLGYNFTISGFVIHGKKIGRTLGFPTANIHAKNKCLPLNGIYAAICHFNNISYKIALYIGTRETIGDDNEKVIEAYFIDQNNLNLYDEYLEIEIISFIRSDEKFKNRNLLKEQIKKDVDKINKFLD